MRNLDKLLGRSPTANSSPKSVLRQIGITKGSLTRAQIETVHIAMALALSEIRKAELNA